MEKQPLTVSVEHNVMMFKLIMKKSLNHRIQTEIVSYLIIDLFMAQIITFLSINQFFDGY